jgi:hypothetical protein
MIGCLLCATLVLAAPNPIDQELAADVGRLAGLIAIFWMILALTFLLHREDKPLIENPAELAVEPAAEPEIENSS